MITWNCNHEYLSDMALTAAAYFAPKSSHPQYDPSSDDEPDDCVCVVCGNAISLCNPKFWHYSNRDLANEDQGLHHWWGRTQLRHLHPQRSVTLSIISGVDGYQRWNSFRGETCMMGSWLCFSGDWKKGLQILFHIINICTNISGKEVPNLRGHDQIEPCSSGTIVCVGMGVAGWWQWWWAHVRVISWGFGHWKLGPCSDASKLVFVTLQYILSQHQYHFGNYLSLHSKFNSYQLIQNFIMCMYVNTRIFTNERMNVQIYVQDQWVVGVVQEEGYEIVASLTNFP